MSLGHLSPGGGELVCGAAWDGGLRESCCWIFVLMGREAGEAEQVQEVELLLDLLKLAAPTGTV